MKLTPMQMKCLDLVVQGLSNKEISRRLGIALPTVRSHLHAAYRTLGIRNRVQAAVIMMKARP